MKQIPEKWIFWILLSILIFYPTLLGTPLWDDLYFVFFKENFVNQSMDSIDFLNRKWIFADLIFYILIPFFGKNYVLYHTLNLSIHGINSFLLFRLFKRSRIPNPELIALMFLAHPQNALSVGWLYQLKTLLAGFGVILFFTFLGKFHEHRKMKYFWYLLVSGIFAIYSKASALPLIPFLIFEIIKISKEYPKKVKLAVGIGGAFVFLFFIYIVFAMYPSKTIRIISHVAYGIDDSTPFIELLFRRILFSMEVVRHYFLSIFWFADQSPIYPHFAQDLDGKGFFRMGEFLFWAGILFYIYFKKCIWKKYPFENFLLLGGVLFLAPFLGIITPLYFHYTPVSDQHMYIPLMFILPLMSMVIEHGVQRFKVKGVFERLNSFSLLFLLSFYFGIISFNYSSIFKDNETLFLYAQKMAPNSVYARLELFQHYQREGLETKALTELINAKRILMDGLSREGQTQRYIEDQINELSKTPGLPESVK